MSLIFYKLNGNRHSDLTPEVYKGYFTDDMPYKMVMNTETVNLLSNYETYKVTLTLYDRDSDVLLQYTADSLHKIRALEEGLKKFFKDDDKKWLQVSNVGVLRRGEESDTAVTDPFAKRTSTG